jgi:hypothetical protein
MQAEDEPSQEAFVVVNEEASRQVEGDEEQKE